MADVEKALYIQQIVMGMSDKMVPTIISGEAKIAQNNGVQAVDTVLGGSRSVFIGGTSNTVHFYLIVAPEIKSIKDLKGKSISPRGRESNFWALGCASSKGTSCCH